MIKKLADKISRAFAASGTAEPHEKARARAIHTAAAVLMTEVARADFDYDESEFSLLPELITSHFKISPDEAVELANAAVQAAEDHVSLHRFTQLLNKNLSEREKEHIVSLLWQVAYADTRLDKHEDALVLKISDLLYVSRVRVMRLKHDANPHNS